MYFLTLDILISFFIRLLFAWLIKVSIGAILGFKSEHSVRVIVKTTIISQVILNFLLISQIYCGMKYALIIFLSAMFVILIVESIIYFIYIEERDKTSRVGLALIANMASGVVGYFILYIIEWVSF